MANIGDSNIVPIGDVSSLNKLSKSPQSTECPEVEEGFTLVKMTSELGIQQLTDLAVLDLSDSRLLSLPESIYELSSLVYLNASGNRIKNLSDSIGRITHLQELNLSNNILLNLPNSVGKLSELVKFNLGFNWLCILPNSIWGLPKLVNLNLEFNKLSILSGTIGRSSSLKELYLGQNQFVSFPIEIYGLTQLEILDLSDNKIKELPNWIEKRLHNLRVFKIENNPLELSESICRFLEKSSEKRQLPVLSLSMPLQLVEFPQKSLNLDLEEERPMSLSMEWCLAQLYLIGVKGYQLSLVAKNDYLPTLIDISARGCQVALRVSLPKLRQGYSILKGRLPQYWLTMTRGDIEKRPLLLEQGKANSEDIEDNWEMID